MTDKNYTYLVTLRDCFKLKTDSEDELVLTINSSYIQNYGYREPSKNASGTVCYSMEFDDLLPFG